jgi:type IV pilus assembly protein PilW
MWKIIRGFYMESNKYFGFTLLEVLLSIGLSAFILSGAYLLFASHRQSYMAQQALIQVKENGQAVINVLRDNLRQAGSLGCSAWHAQLPVFNKAASLPEHLPQYSHEIVYGFHANNNTWSPPLPTYLKNRVRDNTDVLVVHQAHVQSANLAQAMLNTQSPLVLRSDLNLKVGDAIVVADCTQADIVRISDISRSGNYWFIAHHAPYNTTSHLSKAYNTNAEVSVLQSAAYYIGNTGRRYAKGEPIYALYQFVGEHQELVEGVTDLQVEFGIDANHDTAVDTITTQRGQDALRSVILTLETQSSILVDLKYHFQKWYASVTLRN